MLAGIPDLLHGFSTRASGNARDPVVARNLAKIAGGQDLRLLQQIHGNRIVSVSAPGGCPRGDGWAGVPAAGTLHGILTADCVPVLLVHPSTRKIALAHAGWRGAAAGVVEQALAALGEDPVQVRAALGPAIGPCCYQVGPEVAEVLGPTCPHLSPWEAAGDRLRFDLPGYVAERLYRGSVPRDTVDVLGLCTRCERRRFFSYRGGDPEQRMVAFLGWSPAGPREWERR
jgi:YfiH family protein